MKEGISICILTYNVFFYNRLALAQIRKLTRLIDYEILVYDNGSTDGSMEWLKSKADVRLWTVPGNTARHGAALDFLVKQAKYPIVCTLDSDAFPVSPEWTTPALHLDSNVVVAGIDRGWGRQIQNYVCPSYLFGWTDWLKTHTFLDEWPNADTGEKMGQACTNEGRRMQLWKYRCPDWDGKFKANKPCDYNGWVWHTWWGGRSKSIPGLVGKEFEEGYHEYVQDMLREKYQLDY